MSNNEELQKREIFKARLEELIHDDENDKSKIAALIGVGYSTYSNSVNYGIIPKTKTLIKFADYFKVPIDFLLGQSDDDYFVPSNRNETFIDRLMILKAEQGIKSDYELAQKLLINRSLINDWKNRNGMPNIEMVEDIARYFKVSMDYLLGRID